MNRQLPALIGFLVFIAQTAAFSSYGKHTTPPLLHFCTGAAPDTIAPTIVCPNDTVLYLEKGTCSVKYVYEVLAFSGADTLLPERRSGLPSGEAFPLGLTINRFEVTDTAGNSAECTFTVEVKGDSLPLLCAQELVVFLGPACQTQLTAQDLVLPQGYYACPDKIGVFIGAPGPVRPAVFDHSDLGQSFQVFLRDSVTAQSCSVEVTEVRDTLPPKLTCPTVQVPCVVPVEHLSPTYLRDSLGLANGYPIIEEDCPGDVSVLFVSTSADYPCDSVGKAGLVRRFWTVVDAQGNFSTCIQLIERMRDVQGVQLPPDTTVSCTAIALPEKLGWPYYQVGQGRYAIDSTAHCDMKMAYSDEEESLCGGSRLVRRLWTVRDGCRADDPDAKPFVGEQVIELSDGEGPTVLCPPILGVTLIDTACLGSVEIPHFIVSDHCSPIVYAALYWNGTDSLEAELSDFVGNDSTRFDTMAVFGQITDVSAGLLPMSLVTRDTCGNVGRCDFQLDVRDRQPPVAVCDSILPVFLNETGTALLPADLLDNGSTDECRPVRFKVRRASSVMCSDADAFWDDQLRVCCADAAGSLTAVLRVYDAEVPAGPIADTVAQGHYTECTTQIEVTDNTPLRCQAPADTFFLCSDFDPTLEAYGTAELPCRADSVAVLIDTSAFRWSCGSGLLVRTYRVFDKSGNSAQCVQRITGLENYHYFVRFPDDYIAYDCLPPDSLLDRPVVYGEGCEDIAVEYTESRRDSVSDACFYLIRTWTVYNRCTYDPDEPLVVVPNPEPYPFEHPDNRQGPVVSAPGTVGDWQPTVVNPSAGAPPLDYSSLWNPYANGYRYEQIIQVRISRPPVVANCPSDPLLFEHISASDTNFWVLSSLDICEGDVDLSITVANACIADEVVVQYELFLDIDGDQQPESVVHDGLAAPPGVIFYQNAALPNYAGGTPLAFDRRPVSAVEKYRFDLVRDLHGDSLRVQLVWRRESDSSYILPKLPRGIHRMVWTIRGPCDEQVTCEQQIQVGDLPYACAPPVQTISGRVQTEDNKGIQGVLITLAGDSPLSGPFVDYALTQANGSYTFSIPASATFEVTPSFDGDHLNGVTTLDLLLINKHILAVEPLGSPYRIIAADANGSRSVTTFDILELRKLILGIYSELPASPSWRFVPADYVFPSPLQPFQPPFPENIQSADSIALNFIGIKVGDVNGSAKVNWQGEGAETRRRELEIVVEDRLLRAGEEVVVALRVEEAVAGIQGTLEGVGLQFLEVLAEGGFGPEHFALLNEGKWLTFSWEGAGAPVLLVRVRALRNTPLSEGLLLSDAVTRPEAYSLDLREVFRPRLRFSADAQRPSGGSLSVGSRPNPFREEVRLFVHFPQEGLATLRLWDVTGRLLWTKTANFPSGLHLLLLTGRELGSATGVLHFTVETERERASCRLMRY